MNIRSLQHNLQQKAWIDRAAKLRRDTFPAGYTAWRPKRAGELNELRKTMLEAANLLALNASLSEVGREERFTETDGKLALQDLNKMGSAIKRERRALQEKREELRAARQPKAPDLHATLELGIALLLTQGNEGARANLMRSIREAPADGRASRIQEAFLALPAEALGATGAGDQQTLRRSLGVDDLGTEGQKLDLEEHLLNVEENAVKDLRIAVAQMANVETLVAEGFLEKPFAFMTPDERVAYTREHGVDALQELALGDAALFGTFITPDEDQPSDPASDAPPAPQSAAA